MADAAGEQRRGGGLTGSVFTVLGILMGTASLISLVQRWTGIEIVSEIARDAMSLYRQMMEQFHLVLFDWWAPVYLPWGWTFEMPMWGMDLLAVWMLAGAADFLGRNLLRPEVTLRTYLVHILWVPVWPIRLVSFWFTVVASLALGRPVLLSSLAGGSEGGYLSEAFKSFLTPFMVPGAAALFFLWNALQLTPQ
ncbi:hypothetical protein [Maricaulis sp.]|uniref:hypothetical protein n=1 Tax=Maricaulis sp. TaxID=1486257 RepID=UPI000C3FF236|nr:hypothetical protein [Maricaulis sp.]MAC89336.1 hypothetical protein [Maricaulis sp.]